MPKIKVFTSEHCVPCHEVVDLIKKGKHFDDIELVDIETEEGFSEFKKSVLNKGDGAVPSAYKDGIKCSIGVDEDDNLVFTCPPGDSLSSAEEK